MEGENGMKRREGDRLGTFDGGEHVSSLIGEALDAPGLELET